MMLHGLKSHLVRIFITFVKRWIVKSARPFSVVFLFFTSFGFGISSSSASMCGVDYGGITLDKTLNLLNSIENLVGARYDTYKGEIVFVGQGKAETSVDLEIGLDDLVVATRSIYGVNSLGTSEYPGVTFESTSSTDYDGKHIVQFIGATRDTAFGKIVYDADYMLKTLALGVRLTPDGLSGELLRDLPEFQSIGYHTQKSNAQILLESARNLNGISVRFWISPQAPINLVRCGPTRAVVCDEESFIFQKDSADPSKDVKMQIYAQVEPETAPTDGSIRQEDLDYVQNISNLSAQYLTTHYDTIATFPGFESLEKLKRLAKVTALVRWLHDSGIPVDLSFMDGYELKQNKVDTPRTVKLLQLCIDKSTNEIIPSLSGPWVPLSCFNNVTGGIGYDKINTYADLPSANDFSLLDILSAGADDPLRPLNAMEVNDLKWNFDFPASTPPELTWNETTYGKPFAIAQTLAESPTPGSENKTYTDLNFPTYGDLPFSINRYYDSFNLNRQDPFGAGWNGIPQNMVFPEARAILCPELPDPCVYSYPRIQFEDKDERLTTEFEPFGFTEFVNEVDGSIELGPRFVSTDINDIISQRPDGLLVYSELDHLGNITKETIFQPGIRGKRVASPLITYTNAAAAEPSESWVSYSYNNTGEMVKVTSGQGNELGLVLEGKKVKSAYFQTNSGVRDVQYSYDVGGQLQTVQSSTQNTEYVYEGAAKPSENALDSVINRIHTETVMKLESDFNGRVIQSIPENDPNLRQSVHYDKTQGLERRTDSRNRVVETVRDLRGRVTKRDVTVTLGGLPTKLSTSMLYEHANELAGPTTETDARGQNALYDYDIYSGELKSVTNALGHTVTIERGVDSADSFPITVFTDAKGRKSAIKKDLNGRVIAKYRRITVSSQTLIPPPNPGDPPFEEYSFTFSYKPGFVTFFNYDLGTGDLGSISNDGVSLAAEYPWIAEVPVTLSNKTEFGQARDVTTAAGYAQRREFDSLSRLVSIQQPADVSPTTYEYHESGYAQDQVASVDNSLGKTTVGFDIENRTSTVSDTKGVRTTYQRNRKNQLNRVTEVSPAGDSILTSLYDYNIFGELTKKRLPNGSQVSYQYDDLGRILNRTEVEGADVSSTNLPPTLTNVPPVKSTLTAGSTFTFDVNASDPESGQLSYQLAGGPDGMTIDPTSGVITWTPTVEQYGSVDVVVQVIDSEGGVTNHSFTLNVDDSIASASDNCTSIANPDQRDTDGDGYGNACDTDLNNDGRIDFADLALIKKVFGSTDPDADFNGDGIVNKEDLNLLKQSFGGAPGPSGLVP